MSKEQIRKNLENSGLATFQGEYLLPTKKAYDLIETEKDLPKGMKYRCFVCHTIVDKKCVRCENYFCKEHRVFEYEDETVLCKPCDDFILKNF